MLRRIKAEQLQVGMFVARLGGSWINHPFWRARFLLNSEDQVNQIRSAGVQEVWIDILKGRNLPAPEAPPPEIALPELAAPASTLEAEFVHARELLQSGKSVIGSMFADVRMGRALEVNGALLLVDSASKSLSRHSQALIALARLKARDDYSYLHSFAVCALMIAVGRTLELPEEEVRELGLAGLIHDIGKLTLPEAVLHKAASRTPAEDEAIRRHPSAGYRILNEARLYSNIPLDVCVHHHERVDGRGYPDGLKGDEISTAAKIVNVADAFDAMTTDRPYRAGMTFEQAIAQMQEKAGTQFAAEIVEVLVKAVRGGRFGLKTAVPAS
jgi:cyclic di-GMP phosphodiesterase